MPLGIVDDEALAGVVEEVAGHLERDVHFLVHQPGRLDRLGLLLEPRPEAREVAQVALQVLEPVTLGDGAHDEAGVLGLELLGDVAQTLALALSEAPGDADAAPAGDVDKVAAGQGDLGAQPGALVAHRVLGDLHHDLLAVLERVPDAAGALLPLGRGHLVDVEEPVLLEAEVDERGVDAVHDVLDLALVDVAQVRLAVGTLDVDLRQPAVLDERDAQFLAVVGHEDDLAFRLLGLDARPARSLLEGDAGAQAAAFVLTDDGLGAPVVTRTTLGLCVRLGVDCLRGLGTGRSIDSRSGLRRGLAVPFALAASAACAASATATALGAALGGRAGGVRFAGRGAFGLIGRSAVRRDRAFGRGVRECLRRRRGGPPARRRPLRPRERLRRARCRPCDDDGGRRGCRGGGAWPAARPPRRRRHRRRRGSRGPRAHSRSRPPASSRPPRRRAPASARSSATGASASRAFAASAAAGRAFRALPSCRRPPWRGRVLCRCRPSGCGAGSAAGAAVSRELPEEAAATGISGAVGRSSTAARRGAAA